MGSLHDIITDFDDGSLWTYINETDKAELLSELEQQDDSGETPLTLACKNNKISMVGMLAASDASLITKNRYGQTPITIALNPNTSEVARVLFTERSLRNQKLFGAVRANNTEEVKRLLEAGASPCALDETTHQSVILLATMMKRHEIIKLLLSTDDKGEYKYKAFTIPNVECDYIECINQSIGHAAQKNNLTLN